MVLISRAASTNKKYAAGWRRWKDWASRFAIPVFPALPLHVALYLRHLLSTANTISPLECAIYSIAWAHTVASATSPTTHPLVISTFAGCKRHLAKSRAPKKPISPSMLESYIDTCPEYTSNLDDMRTLFVVLVGYAGFLRVNEILNIQVRHITIEREYMQIFLPKRKNDQFRQGQQLHIARSHKKTCPVAITECLLSNLPDDKDSPNLVVRRIIHTKHGKRFHPHLGISYSRIRDIIKQKFGCFFLITLAIWERIVYDQEEFQIQVSPMYQAKFSSVTEDGSSHSQKINILNQVKTAYFFRPDVCLFSLLLLILF